MPAIDLLNGILTVFFQGALALVPFYLLLKNWTHAAIWAGVLIVLSLVLYRTWYRNLPTAEET